jgi:predicted porin
MKKLLIATAALAMVAGTVQAQSSVSVYGRVAAEYRAQDYVNKTLSMEGSSNTSLGTSILGFRGTEDLGGGLKANFVLEGGLFTTDGSMGANNSTSTVQATQLFSRQSWVGLSSANLGAIKVGRTESATKVIEGMGDLGTNIFDVGSLVDTLTDRFASTVSYATPVVAGFTAEFTHSGASSATSSSLVAGREINAANIQYKAGPLHLAVGQAQSEDNGYTMKNTLFGASYNAGFATFEAAYQAEQRAANDTDKLMQIGAIIPLTPKFDIRVNYSKYNDGLTSATDVSYTGALAVYHLSKRTHGFAGFRMDKSDTASLDGTLTTIGLQHAF